MSNRFNILVRGEPAEVIAQLDEYEASEQELRGALINALQRIERLDVALTREIARRTADVPAVIEVIYITAHQKAVLNHLALGDSNPQIAGKLGLAVKTVKTHVSAIFKATGAPSRAVLVKALAEKRFRIEVRGKPALWRGAAAPAGEDA